MIDALRQLYRGFYLEQRSGNNAFAYDRRDDQRLYVPPLITGSLEDVYAGEQTVFAEHVEDSVICYTGLKQFIYYPYQNKHVFVMDNHNHAFCFWMFAYQQKWFLPGVPLIHVDQHKDTRQPDAPPPAPLMSLTLEDAFAYTHHVLNVGNFIPPALDLGLFSRAEMMVASEDFKRSLPQSPVLDIDLDIFAPVMDYIDQDIKIDTIRSLITHASVITVATSPFFFEQALSKKFLKLLFA